MPFYSDQIDVDCEPHPIPRADGSAALCIGFRVFRALTRRAVLFALLLVALVSGSTSRAANGPAEVKDLGAPVPGLTSETSPSDEPALVSKLEDSPKLAIGDRVSFRVVEEKLEPKLLLVADSGELEVPYVGRVMAKDRTCQELTREIKAKLEEKYFYRASVILSVELLNPVRGSVYLFGEVRSAGSQALPSGEALTLAKAIIRSGGFTDFADKRRVTVTRESASGSGAGNQKFTVDVGRVLQRGMTQKDMKLEPGDVIYVPTRLVNF